LEPIISTSSHGFWTQSEQHVSEWKQATHGCKCLRAKKMAGLTGVWQKNTVPHSHSQVNAQPQPRLDRFHACHPEHSEGS
jgi:hypothetical protein